MYRVAAAARDAFTVRHHHAIQAVIQVHDDSGRHPAAAR